MQTVAACDKGGYVMKAAVLKSSHVLRVEEIPKFPLEPGMVTLKVKACGVCGSDFRYYVGENPWALHTLGKALPNPPNIVLGHEYAGVVVEAASKDGESLMGKRVVAMCFRTCGECALCRTGRPNLCKNTRHIGHGAGWGKRDYYPGAMAEYCPAWADSCCVIPEHLSFEEAAMADIIGVGVHAVGLADVREGDSVAVFGCGPIGCAIIQVARARGASRVIATDKYGKALEIAKQSGADSVIDVTRSSPVDVILSSTGGKGCSAVFDTVGTNRTVGDGLSALAESGSFINLAVHSVKLDFDAMKLSAERKFRSSANFLPEEFPAAVNLLATGKVNVAPWITHRFALSEAARAFELGFEKERHSIFKIVILP